MKVGGSTVKGPNVITVVFPREGLDEEGKPLQDIVFKAQAVLDMGDFEVIFKEPSPPIIKPAKGESFPDLKDKKYLLAMNEHNEKRYQYLILKSLDATPGLEWDTVDMKEPSTWKNWEEDLKNSGFSNAERNQLQMAVFDANSLNEGRLKEAKDRFTRSQVLLHLEQSSQKEEPSSTASGEPAKD